MRRGGDHVSLNLSRRKPSHAGVEVVLNKLTTEPEQTTNEFAASTTQARRVARAANKFTPFAEESGCARALGALRP